MNKFKEFGEEDLILDQFHAEEPYRRRKDEEKKSIAYGQRKLFLMLLYFVSKYVSPYLGEKKCIIVYAGAAPGNNIKIVADLFRFKNLEWHLYDPAAFRISTDLKNNFFIYRKKFTDETALYWKNINQDNIFFISDIRTADYTRANNLEENETEIITDMNLQKKWVEIISPKISFLKFRLPYAIPNVPSHFKYFGGILYKQPFAPQTSTECRLCVTDITKLEEYDCRKYESQMFYHNVIIRENFVFDNKYADREELTNDYDCSAETFIWNKYLENISRNNFANLANLNVKELSENLTNELSKGKKNIDTLSFLRKNPQHIKNRNKH